MDPMAELAYDFPPYRYGFNNPVYWGDASGLFETPGQAHTFAISNGLKFHEYIITENKELGGYNLTIIAGKFMGDVYYNFAELLPEMIVEGRGRGSSNSGNNSKSENSNHKGLMFTEFGYSVAGAYGEAIDKNGKYTQTNGNKGNFNDRPYKSLSRNAKANYNFAKNLKLLKKAGTITAVVSGTIDVSNGIIEDYRNYEETGHTNYQHTVTATVKVGTGVAVGWAAGALTGGIIGSSVPIAGTIIGAVVGGIAGYYASEAAESYMDSVYK